MWENFRVSENLPCSHAKWMPAASLPAISWQVQQLGPAGGLLIMIIVGLGSHIDLVFLPNIKNLDTYVQNIWHKAEKSFQQWSWLMLIKSRNLIYWKIFLLFVLLFYILICLLFQPWILWNFLRLTYIYIYMGNFFSFSTFKFPVIGITTICNTGYESWTRLTF